MSGPSLSKAPAPPKKRWRLLWLFLIYLGLGLLLAFLSPWLPASEGAKRVATRIWGPVLTDSYPGTGRDQITVLLIDDKDLREYGEVWPVSLGFHERRLLELLKYRPKAVFFDIVFLDDRKDPDLDGFVGAACKARQAGIPVFIGSFGNIGFAPSRTERTMLERRVDVGGRSLPCIEAAYLNMRIDGYDQSVWEYDIDVPPQGEAARRAGAVFPSPAARLFRVEHALDPQVAAEPMALVWGTASDPRNLEWLNSDLRPGGPGAYCTSTWAWRRVLPIGKGNAPLCPYQQLLPVRTLKRVHGLDADDLGEAIGGKYLIYGTQLQSNGDVILAPYHGRIAGAFLHAMALDNLLSFAGKPKAGGDFGQPWNGPATWFTLFAVAIISALIAAGKVFKLSGWLRVAADRMLGWWSRDAGERDTLAERAGRQAWLAGRRSTRGLLAWLMLASVYLATVGLLVMVSYTLMDLGPLVWIEFALFPISMELLHVGDMLIAWWARGAAYCRKVWRAIVTPPSARISAPAAALAQEDAAA